MPNRVMGTLVLVALFIALSAFASLTFKQSNRLADAKPAMINVTGTAEVFAIPDIAQFSFGVRAEGADVKTVKDQSAASVNAVLKYLKEQGIEDKDIKTENYYQSPKYRYVQTPCVFGSVCPPGEQVQDGFEVVQTISIKVRKVETVGELLSQVGTLGATDISGITFTVADEEAVKADARDKAIVDAKAKAAKLASSLGVRLVRIVSFNENVGGGYPMYAAAPMADMAGAKEAIVPAVPVGENKTTSNVTITYEVR